MPSSRPTGVDALSSDWKGKRTQAHLRSGSGYLRMPSECSFPVRSPPLCHDMNYASRLCATRGKVSLMDLGRLLTLEQLGDEAGMYVAAAEPLVREDQAVEVRGGGHA